MAELKTRETGASVEAFLAKISGEQRRADSRKIVAVLSRITRAEPRMWGPSIVGFGSRRLRYASGRELDWMIVGFSPRKTNLTLYVLTGDEDPRTMKALGKHKVGKGCLYIDKLSDVDLRALEKLVSRSVKTITSREAPRGAGTPP